MHIEKLINPIILTNRSKYDLDLITICNIVNFRYVKIFINDNYRAIESGNTFALIYFYTLC